MELSDELFAIAGDLRDRVHSAEHGLHARKAGSAEGTRSESIPGDVGGLRSGSALVCITYLLLVNAN